jgi:hypothetical protein
MDKVQVVLETIGFPALKAMTL